MQKLNKINNKINKYWKWFEKGKDKITMLKMLLNDENFAEIIAPSKKDHYILNRINHLVKQRRLLQCKKK